MGKREEAHRELEHALAAIADVAPDNDKAWAITRALRERNWTAYGAFDLAQQSIWQAHHAFGIGATRDGRVESIAAMRKLAPVMLDILLGEEE